MNISGEELDGLVYSLVVVNLVQVGKELARTTYMKWHQIPDQNWKTKDGAEVLVDKSKSNKILKGSCSFVVETCERSV